MELEVIDAPDNPRVVRLSGRLDAAGADRIGLKFTTAVVAAGQPVLVDLSEVSFIASLGLRLLISSAKGLAAKGAGMAVFGARPEVAELLDQVALDQIVPVADTREVAQERLSAA
jgi:anti-anti-sigma factor